MTQGLWRAWHELSTEQVLVMIMSNLLCVWANLCCVYITKLITCSLVNFGEWRKHRLLSLMMAGPLPEALVEATLFLEDVREVETGIPRQTRGHGNPRVQHLGLRLAFVPSFRGS